jgi:hypothetical protein
MTSSGVSRQLGLVVFPVATGPWLAQADPDAQVEPDQLQPDQLQPIVEMR